MPYLRCAVELKSLTGERGTGQRRTDVGPEHLTAACLRPLRRWARRPRTWPGA